MRCAVKNCGKNNKKIRGEVSFFSFPRDAHLQKQWESFCCRGKDMKIKTSYICMEHFKPEDFENNLEYEMGFTKRRFLKHGAVPSMKKSTSAKEKLGKERTERIMKRENKKTVEALLEDHNAELISVKEEPIESVVVKEEEVITIQNEANMFGNLDGNGESNEVNCLKNELERLRKENADLKRNSQKQASELKAFAEKWEREVKVFECDMNALETRLAKTNYKLNNLEKNFWAFLQKAKLQS